MAKYKCTAIAEHGRINLIIQKGEKGYKAFSQIIDKIEKKGIFAFYADVTDERGKEQDGIVITDHSPGTKADQKWAKKVLASFNFEKTKQKQKNK